MKGYIKAIRFDECKKIIYIIPGFLSSILITHNTIDTILIIKVILCVLSGTLISFANDLMNDYFDLKYDKYHPIKRDRFFVVEKIDKKIVFLLCLLLILSGLVLSFFINIYCFIAVLIFAINSILYQSHLLNLKETPIIDIFVEALDILLLFLLGWFSIDTNIFPSNSLIVACFMASAFLNALKRYFEIKLIEEKEIMISYRLIYFLYTDVFLLILSFFFALIAIFLFTVSLVSYRLELIFFIPFLVGLLCFDLYLALTKENNNDKVFFDDLILIYRLALLLIFIILMLVDIPIFHG